MRGEGGIVQGIEGRQGQGDDTKSREEGASRKRDWSRVDH